VTRGLLAFLFSVMSLYTPANYLGAKINPTFPASPKADTQCDCELAQGMVEFSKSETFPTVVISCSIKGISVGTRVWVIAQMSEDVYSWVLSEAVLAGKKLCSQAEWPVAALKQL